MAAACAKQVVLATRPTRATKMRSGGHVHPRFADGFATIGAERLLTSHRERKSPHRCVGSTPPRAALRGQAPLGRESVQESLKPGRDGHAKAAPARPRHRNTTLARGQPEAP